MPTRSTCHCYDARLPQFLIVAGLVAALPISVLAAGPWREIVHPGVTFQHPTDYDSDRGRMVLFGGQTPQGYSPVTYEWDGQRWHRAATGGLQVRDSHKMVYDSGRKRVVLFGGVRSIGSGSIYLGDTWEWDGQTWTLMSTTGPDPRARYVMSYDSDRGRVVLFGGTTVIGKSDVITFDDTWEWDGERWTLMDVGGGPTARRDATMVYDEARGVSLLFAGLDIIDYVGDTWAWDGQSWSLVTLDGPPCRAFHMMTYDPDRDRSIVFGGGAPCVNWPFISDQQDTWEWDGETWTEEANGGPFKRRFGALSYDTLRDRTVLFGGWPASFKPDGGGPIMQDLPLGDLWEWDGMHWEERLSTTPRARYGHRMSYDSDRGVAVLHGGRVSIFQYENETWEWDGSRWERRVFGGPIGPNNPERRGFHAQAYDSTRQVTWMFGGARNNSGNPYDETWKWDGGEWTLVDTVTDPPDRYAHAMTYDAGRDRLVMFGGISATGSTLGDTWEFDGDNWALRQAPGPANRFEHVMAYDASRGRVVLFGGTASSLVNVPRFGDTWEWDGKNWTLVSETGPAPRQGAAAAYDSRRGRVIIRGGVTTSDGQFELLDDTWAWDGEHWTQLADDGPGNRYVETMVYESDRDRLFLFGGTNGVGAAGDILGEMWTYYLGIPGDGDGDGDVDLFDYAAYLDCVSGPGGGVQDSCGPFDFDDDGDVDFMDLKALMIGFTG